MRSGIIALLLLAALAIVAAGHSGADGENSGSNNVAWSSAEDHGVVASSADDHDAVTSSGGSDHGAAASSAVEDHGAAASSADDHVAAVSSSAEGHDAVASSADDHSVSASSAGSEHSAAASSSAEDHAAATSSGGNEHEAASSASDHVAAVSSSGSDHSAAASSSGSHSVESCPQSSYSCDGKCVSCPANSWSAKGSTSASDCVCWYGYEAGSDGACEPINSGEHSGSGNNGATNSTCDPEKCVKECGEGYYSSTGTWDCTNKWSKCKKCPKYSWSPSGSDSKSDCVCWAGYEGPAGGPCKAVTTTPAPTGVDGGWCPASECSATCGSGTQTRVCACPAPSGGGAECSGESTVTCAQCSCSDAPSGSKMCPESTYSASGMYVSDKSECTACPEYSWSPMGSRNITDCGCWDRYTGPAGGPCTFITGNFDGGWCPWLACDKRCGDGGVKTRVCGCPYQSGNGTDCVGASTAACDSLPECGAQPVETPCSGASDESECSSWQGCQAVNGYACDSKEWSYMGCVKAEEASSCMPAETCGVNSKSGARGWFPSTLLPSGWVETTVMGGVSCCKQENCSSSMPLPGSGHGDHGSNGGGNSGDNSTDSGSSTGGSDNSGGNSGNNGTDSSGSYNVTVPGVSSGGCTWQLGCACVVLQFRGACPVDVASIEAWAIGLYTDLQAQLRQLTPAQLAALESQVSAQVVQLLSGVDLSRVAALLAQYVRIVVPPTANNGTGSGTYSVVVQVAGQSVSLPYSPAQVVAALQAVLAVPAVAGTEVASQLQGVASYALMSNVVASTPTSVAASGAGELMSASLLLVVATGVVGTVVAKVASFMQ